MVLDMNIELSGIDEEFLENLAELIEDTRVEYFIINPRNKEDLQKAQELCAEVERFKYTLPVEFKSLQDKNCVAIRITKAKELTFVEDKPLVIDSKDLTDEFIELLNKSDIKGVILDAKQSDNKLENFAYSTVIVSASINSPLTFLSGDNPPISVFKIDPTIEFHPREKFSKKCIRTITTNIIINKRIITYNSYTIFTYISKISGDLRTV